MREGKRAAISAAGRLQQCCNVMCVLCLQSLQERTQAEQFLRVFGLSTEYVSHCKVCKSGNLAVQCPLATFCTVLVPAASSMHVHGMVGMLQQLLTCPQCLLLNAGHIGQLTVALCSAACLLQPAQGGY